MHSVRRLDICTLQGLPVLCSLSGKRAHVRAGQFPPDVPGGRHPLTDWCFKRSRAMSCWVLSSRCRPLTARAGHARSLGVRGGWVNAQALCQLHLQARRGRVPGPPPQRRRVQRVTQARGSWPSSPASDTQGTQGDSHDQALVAGSGGSQAPWSPAERARCFPLPFFKDEHPLLSELTDAAKS